MPAVTEVRLFDDKLWPERVPAQEVVRLTVHWQEIGDGSVCGREDVELYLTAAGRGDLVAGLKEYFRLGHQPGAATVSLSRGNWIGGSRQASIDHWRDVRDFADAFGLKNKKEPGRVAYEMPGGSWSYPKWLREAFARWTAAGCPQPGGDWAPEKAA